MISVLPSKDITETENLFKKHGFKTDEYSGCVIARTGNEMLGYCLYRLDDKSITVLTVEPESDIMLADGILRSALHVAAERFVLDAYYSDTASEGLFKNLGFIKNEADKSLDMNLLFGGCKCSNKGF